MKWWRRVILSLVGSLLACCLLSMTAAAQQYTSPSYSLNEVFFGSGGELNTCSTGPTGYCAKDAVGELGVGNSASTSYQIEAGFNTTDAPFLEFVVTGSNINLGYLSTSSATTATGTFTVRAWNSSGYIVQNASPPPVSNGPSPHTLTALTSATASSPGSEQFGINLVKNANFCGGGCDLGADPSQQPDSTFSFGAAAAGYNTANHFKYVNGDTVADSTKSTSVTLYTVSYIFNINAATPAGQYTFTHVLVATATY